MGRGDSKTVQPVSFRFDLATVEELRERATQRPENQTELAERYIVEGMRQDEHPLIHFRDGASGRRPSLLGSGLDVADIVTTIRQNKNSIPAAAEYLEIPVEQVEAAAQYYADYKDEVEAWIRQSEEIANRERERFVRQQEAFA